MQVLEVRDPIEALVHSHLRFVIKLAREYRGFGVPFEDLLNEGNLGLIEAARRFDAGRGVRFTTYASWWIRKFLLKAVREQTRVVRIPDHRLRLASAAREECARRAQRLGRRTAPDEIAATPIEVSLSEERGGGDARSPLAERIADRSQADPEALVVRSDLTRRLESAVQRLSHRTWRVLRDRFGLGGAAPLTLKEVGEREGISRERARQIESEALARLRRELTRRPLRPH